jgi:hypothetical protein
MAKPTGELLTKLRSAMKNTAYVPDILHAYIIPSEDAHQVIMDSVSSCLIYKIVESFAKIAHFSYAVYTPRPITAERGVVC